MVQLKMSLHLGKMTLRLHKHSITNAHFCIIFSLYFWVDLLNCFIAEVTHTVLLFLFEYCGKTFVSDVYCGSTMVFFEVAWSII